MSGTLLIGSDHALLEGLAQTLAAAGYRVTLADSLHDASALTAGDPPLVIVLDRAAAFSRRATSGSRVRPRARWIGRALPRHRRCALPLPPSLQRLTLADLTLPLERQRLVALVQSVTARARSRGRGDVGPEERPGHRADAGR